MSEKKSKCLERKLKCSICAEVDSDFLELEDFSDCGFIICANCEAMSTSEDLYGEYSKKLYAATRERYASDSGPYPTTYQGLSKVQSQKGSRP